MSISPSQKLIILFLLFISFIEANEEFKLKSITGKVYDLNITKNRISIKQYPEIIIILDFFSKSCAPCKKEFPELIEFQKIFKDSVRIIGVESASQKNDKELIKFARKHKLNYPIISFKESEKLIDFALQKTGWVGALPYKLLYDQTGTLTYKLYGSMTMEKLIEALKELVPKDETNSTKDN
jgi:thiol-disulfide isomerase/thioredoxin